MLTRHLLQVRPLGLWQGQVLCEVSDAPRHSGDLLRHAEEVGRLCIMSNFSMAGMSGSNLIFIR